MKAYGVFDGGGVKGAALAGALKAAETNGIEFAGYGGSSAGSVVALLAAVGYTGYELEKVMTERLSLASVGRELKDPLDALAALQRDLMDPGVGALFRVPAHKSLFRRLSNDLGFSDGRAITGKICELVMEKISGLEPVRKGIETVDQHFTFQDLADLGLPALKIVASDLGMRRPVVFSNRGGDELNGPVLDAVRASMSYPIAFRPLRVGSRLLVDGGLASNLPVFLFEEERYDDGLPLIAFDLVAAEGSPDGGDFDLGTYLTRMLDTALEAGDYLMQQVLCDVHYVPIPVDARFRALQFDLSKDDLKHLFLTGYQAANEYFQSREFEPFLQAGTEIESLQARHAAPADVAFVLGQFANHLERETGLSSVRTNVTLPTSRNTRVVAYQFGMDADADQDLELALDAGCGGRCWSERAPAYADLEDAASADNYLKWKMTKAQQARIRKDRKTMVSIPIFAPGSDERVVGVLSADSDESIFLGDQPDAHRVTRILDIGKQWAVVLTAVLG